MYMAAPRRGSGRVGRRRGGSCAVRRGDFAHATPDLKKTRSSPFQVMFLIAAAAVSSAAADHGPGGGDHHHEHHHENHELSSHHQRTLQKIARQARQNLLDSSSTTIDFSKAYDDPDTGLKCVNKEATVQTKEREKLLQCTHSMINVCHYTYATRFTSQRQEECRDNYEKACQGRTTCYNTLELQVANESLPLEQQ